ncbi:MAG: PQQ-binding-like beta-propeller repeat protein [Oscillospiraceae bacterium]|nr:PQQ-binding-like beta-propeller repeat protein [Oscillospiraceae bacterium]
MREPQTRPPRGNGWLFSAAGALILLLLLALLALSVYRHATAEPKQPPEEITPGTVGGGGAPVLTPVSAGGQEHLPVEETEAIPTLPPTPTPAPTPVPLSDFAPWHTEETDPEIFLFREAVEVDGRILGEDESYSAAEPVDFGYGADYTRMQGIITFRGNNFRDSASYGLANMSERKFGERWSVDTGTFTYDGETWSGSGWVGQPLLVRWPRSTKAVMNMYNWAKQDDELVEVIYATMDGHIYFLDLQNGKPTRDSLDLGFPFKGAGALDPRGYPILYVGAGYDSPQGYARAFVVSLIDFEILYSFGHTDVEARGGFSLRGNLSYFDGSPLVDAETDKLIYPGENGIVYIIKLNTAYDEAAGSLSIDPTVVKWRYYGTRTSIVGGYWVGMEDSPVIWRGHMIIADNGGRLMCIDLNTFDVAWVQDILDDSNATPVLAMEDGHPYIYVSTSFHYGWRSYTTATIPVFKIDAENGEIVWHTDYTCYTESGVSGGVQSTVALGKNELEKYVYVTVAKTDAQNNGLLVCIDRETGEEVWQHRSYYTWSSPVLVYNSDGSGYVVYCNYNKTGTNMYLLDGLTGEVLDSTSLGGGVEASPAVYGDTVVIGTRNCKIWGIKLK